MWILIVVCCVSLIVELEIVFEISVVLFVVVCGLLFPYSLFCDVTGFFIGMELHLIPNLKAQG